MSQFVNLNNRVMNFLSLAALVATFIIGSTGCRNSGHDRGGHDHGGHKHSNHLKKSNDASTHDRSTASQKDYPTDLCVVSNEKLGSMGKPIVVQHDDQEVRLCCKGCMEDFQEDPKKYLARLDASSNHEG